MLVKIEARIMIFPGTDFHFPSTSVPPGTFFRLWISLTLIGHFPLFSLQMIPLQIIQQNEQKYTQKYLMCNVYICL